MNKKIPFLNNAKLHAKKIVICIFILFFSIIQMIGQDYYFSQFYASPLNLNPALTGVSAGDIRLALNYRDQSQNLIPYKTYGGSFDMKMFRGKLDKDIASLGVVAIKDELANNAVSSLYMMASGAYHIALNNKQTHYLSFGFQGGVLQHQLNMNEFSFPNQWTISTFYDPSIPHGINVTTEQTLIYDLNAGMFWYHFIKSNSTVFLGAAVFHVLEPELSFLSNQDNMARRYLVHGGRRIPLSEVISIIPNVMFMQQSGARMVAGGSSMEYAFRDSDFAMGFGLWYRYYNNSIITNLDFQFKNFKFGVSYDVYSSVQSLSETSGGLEFSIIYSPVMKNIIQLEGNPGTSF